LQVLQHRPEPFIGEAQSRFYGTQRNADFLGDLGMGHVMQEAEANHFLLFG
jgi:hypothetical protein